MKLYIDETEVPVLWEENASVDALRELVGAEGLTVSLSRYGGFEQVGPLGASLVRQDRQTTTVPGDIVLYSGNQLVLFFGSNSWAYTRLGRMELDEAQLTELLDRAEVRVSLLLEG